MSASESIATPVRPTSPSASGSSESSPSWVGRSNATERPVWPAVEQEPEPAVRLLGRREAGVLAHRPRPAAVALGADAARVRELARRRAHGRGVVGAVDRLRHCRNDRARAEAGQPRAGTLPGVRITVRLFAALRERAGWSERELDVPDGAAVADVWPQARAGRRAARASPTPETASTPRAATSARRRRRGRGHPAGLGRRVPRPGRSRSTSTRSWPRSPTRAPARSRRSSASPASTAAAGP